MGPGFKVENFEFETERVTPNVIDRVCRQWIENIGLVAWSLKLPSYVTVTFKVDTEIGKFTELTLSSITTIHEPGRILWGTGPLLEF